jgi:hypothetical protein
VKSAISSESTDIRRFSEQSPTTVSPNGELAAVRQSLLRMLVSRQEDRKRAVEVGRARWRAIEKETNGRYLHGFEWQWANAVWNDCFAGLKNEEIPSLPKKATIPEITGFDLARIAVALAKTAKPKRPPTELFGEARELLIQAATYLSSLDVARWSNFTEVSGIPFAEILKSSEKQIPDAQKLLPGITTEDGLTKLIRRYYEAHGDQMPDGQVIPDHTGDAFIEGKYLPPHVIIRIRLWRDKERQTRPKRKK